VLESRKQLYAGLPAGHSLGLAQVLLSLNGHEHFSTEVRATATDVRLAAEQAADEAAVPDVTPRAKDSNQAVVERSQHHTGPESEI
jgi:hypothetical protein